MAVQQLARHLGIPVLFFLHNFGYQHAEPFQGVDYIAVPSEFSRAYYRQTLGLNCHRLPYVIDPARVSVERWPERTDHADHASMVPGDGFHHAERDEYVAGPNRLREREEPPSPHPNPPNPLPAGEGTSRYVTFVNPQTTKGLFVFARIADELARRRPDIPLMVIEGRSAAGWGQETGIDLARLPNVTIRPNAADPRTFYAVSKLLLIPSLWLESFGLVAAEGMFNGIPVLASNRGALPETIGDAGFLFDIPARYTPDTRDVPAAEEVEPWVRTIIRLWDDAAEYERLSRAAQGAGPALASRPACTNLSRVLQPHHPSARPAAGAAGSCRVGSQV